MEHLAAVLMSVAVVWAGILTVAMVLDLYHGRVGVNISNILVVLFVVFLCLINAVALYDLLGTWYS